jgi:hypothetical protein
VNLRQQEHCCQSPARQQTEDLRNASCGPRGEYAAACTHGAIVQIYILGRWGPHVLIGQTNDMTYQYFHADSITRDATMTRAPGQADIGPANMEIWSVTCWYCGVDDHREERHVCAAGKIIYLPRGLDSNSVLVSRRQRKQYGL